MLYFGDLNSTENNGKYRWVNGKTVEIPVLSTTGSVDADNDTIALAKRNFDNKWESKVLDFHRKWSTLVAPTDIMMTNMVATITNITKVYNEFQKFPEKDRYLVSKVYADWTAQSKTADTTALTAQNILQTIDGMLEEFENARVPRSGCILYVTPTVNKLLKEAVTRYMSSTEGTLNRYINVLDDLKVVSVPSDIMKTSFDFTTGSVAASGRETDQSVPRTSLRGHHARSVCVRADRRAFCYVRRQIRVLRRALRGRVHSQREKGRYRL